MEGASRCPSSLLARVVPSPIRKREMKLYLVLAAGVFGFGQPALADYRGGLDALNRGDYDLALQEFRPLAESGRPSAQAVLGIMYMGGYGVPQDYAEAAKRFHLALDQGYEVVRPTLDGLYCEERLEKGSALEWFEERAKQGEAQAQYCFGRLQISPFDNDSSAIAWVKMAAEKGYLEAQRYLAAMYRIRLGGVKKNTEESANWYRRAANQGDAGSQFMMGVLHLNGEGVTQDLVTAHIWFNLAANRGHNKAQQKLAELSTLLTAPQSEEAHRIVREWKVHKE